MKKIAIALMLMAGTAAAGQQYKLVPPDYLSARSIHQAEEHCERIARRAALHYSREFAKRTYRACLLGRGWERETAQISFN